MLEMVEDPSTQGIVLYVGGVYRRWAWGPDSERVEDTAYDRSPGKQDCAGLM